MFVDFSGEPVPPPPSEPPGPRLTPRQQKRLAGIIGLNIVLLLVAPVGGATIIGALIALAG